MPFPLLTIAIEARGTSDRERTVSALATLAIEDRSFHVMIDRESGQILLGGTSELQLDEKIDLLRRRYEIALNIGAPQIAYRETLIKRIEKDYTFKKQGPGAGQFARVKMIVEPHANGTLFESRIASGVMPEAFILGVAKGVESVMGAGIRAGFPLMDVKVTLVAGAYHDVDSSASTFEIAARAAFREALRDGHSVLMEPIMAVEIIVPADYAGAVGGDLSGRRGQLQNQTMRGDDVFIEATAPFANLFGYVNQLRSFTQGRGRHTMRFAFYQAVDIETPPKPRLPPVAAAMRVA